MRDRQSSFGSGCVFRSFSSAASAAIPSLHTRPSAFATEKMAGSAPSDACARGPYAYSITGASRDADVPREMPRPAPGRNVNPGGGSAARAVGATSMKVKARASAGGAAPRAISLKAT